MRLSITPSDRIGPYRIQDRLGVGGMGEVYRAHDDRLDRQVALKVLRSDTSSNPIAHERLRREARAAAGLTHPAIVQIHDILEWEGHDCVVMELVRGRDLTRLLQDGPLTLQQVVTLAGEIAEGLAEAHAHGIVHRDLKTENVMVTPAGHAKILDFGLAKRVLLDRDEPSLSVDGLVVGTCRAMSPEQARGEEVDARSDMFSFGTLLYEVLSGDSPFQASTALETLNRVCDHHPPRLDELDPAIPHELAGLVQRLMEKEPELRPTAKETVSALGRLTFESGSLYTAATLVEGIRPSTAAGASSVSHVAIKTLVLVEPEGRIDRSGTLGGLSASEVAERHDPLVRRLLETHDGQQIERLRGFLLMFERPIDAVAFCLDYHQGLERLSEDLESPWRGHAGLHLGEVTLRESTRGDVLRGARPVEVEGLAKQVALRLAALAVPGQTLMTRGAFDLARRAVVDSAVADHDLRWLAHGAYRFEGLDEPEEVFEVGLADGAPLRVPPDSETVRREVLPGDEITLGWRAAPKQRIPRRPGWVVTDKLGEGGFGEVWLAVHDTTGEKRVFKFCYEADRLRALRREVTLFRLLRESLGHRTDIARILEWNFDEAPYWLESDYSEAGSLLDWAAEQGGLDRVPLATRLELVAQVAEALAAAHSVGVLHKDVKPANVLITRDTNDQPKAVLTDFGIGLLTDRSLLAARGVSAVGLTELMDEATSSTVGGSQIYMAPELLEGKVATVQADIYALGVMLYQMAAGDFHRALASGWQRHVEDEILREDIASLVDGSPERRPASALEVAQRLRRLDERRKQRLAERRAREEEERAGRRRRVLAVTTAVAVVFLVVVGLFALREQSAHREAERRRQQAEELIDFMLFDLRDGLESIGRLDLLEQVARQSQKYFEELPEEDETPTSATKRGITLLNIGDVLLDQGQTEEAMSSYRKALGFFESLTARDPENLEWAAGLARSRTKVGQALESQGETMGALAMHRSAEEILQDLLSRDPANVAWRIALGDSLYRTSQVLHAQGKITAALEASLAALALIEQVPTPEREAREYWELAINLHIVTGQHLLRLGRVEEAQSSFRTGLDLAEKRVTEDPADLQRQDALADAQVKYGFALQGIGKLADALEAFSTARERYRDLVTQQPRNLSWQGRLATTLAMLGQLHDQLGDDAASLDASRQARAAYQKLAAWDPGRPAWDRWMGIIDQTIASVQVRLGNTEQALASYESARISFESVVSRDPADTSGAYLLALTQLELAGLRLARGEPALALDALQQAESIYREQIGKGQADDPLPEAQLCRTYLLRGRALEKLGRTEEAREAWSEAAEIIASVTRRSDASSYLSLQAQTMLHLNRTAEAKPLVATLRSRGWKEPDLWSLARKHGLADR